MTHAANVNRIVLPALLSLATDWALSSDAGGDPRASTPKAPAADARVAAQLATIARTGRQGAGSAEARKARDELARRGVEILPQLLADMDTSNVVAANWYRTVYEDIVARALERTDFAWPREFMNEYVSDA